MTTPTASPVGPAALRLPFRFDAAALRREVDELAREPWLGHFNAAVHDGRWRGLALRAPGGVGGHLLPFAPAGAEPPPTEDTEHLRRSPGLRAVLATFATEIPSARLLGLEPGGRIAEHTDDGLGIAAGLVRLHVPIQTNPGVRFLLTGEAVPLAEGECWYLDAGRPHAVENRGEAARIHLVVDAVVNPWLRRVLEEAGYREEPLDLPYGDPNITDDNVDAVIQALEAGPGEASAGLAARLREVRDRRRGGCR